MTTTVWRNWSRLERVSSRRVERPASPAAVQEAVQRALADGLRVKAVGAGHSFTGVAVAPDLRLELDGLDGLVAAEPATGLATLRAGTRLHQLPGLLAPSGLAMANLGDIDHQTIAGATSTGTHGTGLGFGGLATRIEALSLVTGTGELLEIGPTSNAELLPAARLGLGALGIVAEVTLRLVPAFALHAAEQAEPLAQVLAEWEPRVRSADHFEFYWFPQSRTAFTKTNTRLPADSPLAPLGRLARWVDDELVANHLFRVACELGRFSPAVVRATHALSELLWSNREFTDLSHQVFVTHRGVRFREQEYALPLAALPEVFAEVAELIRRRDWRISFPVEVRAAAADDTWLSTAYGRETAYLAVHRFYKEDHQEYFGAVEQIARSYGGRPHWGKLHTLGAAELRDSYPRFDDFLAVRDRLDPNRVFTNPYLDRVLG